MSQDADPDLFFRMHGDGAADQVANGGVAAVFFQFRRQVDTFSDHDERISLAIALPLGNLATNPVDSEGNFGNQNDVRATRHDGFEGNPAGVAAHDFNDYCSMVRLRGGVQFVDGVGCGLQGSVEAERYFGGRKVIVDCFGYAHQLHAFAKQLEGDGHRAVASDGYECVNAQFPHVDNDFIGNIAHNFLTVSSTAIPEGVTAIGGPQNRATAGKYAAHILEREFVGFLRADQAIEAIGNADHLPFVLEKGALDRSADDGVEAGRIAASGADADTADVRHGDRSLQAKDEELNSGRRLTIIASGQRQASTLRIDA